MHTCSWFYLKVNFECSNQIYVYISSQVKYIYLQFISVTQSCPTLCDPMNRSTPGLPVDHQLPKSTQTHGHWVGDAIQPSHPLSSPSPSTLNPNICISEEIHMLFNFVMPIKSCLKFISWFIFVYFCFMFIQLSLKYNAYNFWI